MKTRVLAVALATALGIAGAAYAANDVKQTEEAVTTAPPAALPFNPARPDGWAVLMNPVNFGQFVNPATYAQFMQPGFYMQFADPANAMAWANPVAYQQFMNPASYMQMANPAAYMQFANPALYAPAMNPASYAAFMNPQVYAQWFNPASYQLASATQGQGGTVFNPFDPMAWTNAMGGQQVPAAPVEGEATQ